jgi:hypothetical protein
MSAGAYLVTCHYNPPEGIGQIESHCAPGAEQGGGTARRHAATLRHRVHIQQTPAALLLTPLLLLRPTHPPLAIPWQAITLQRPGRMLGEAVIELQTAAAPETPFVLPATALADGRERLPPASPGDISLPPGWGEILVILLLLIVSLLFGILWVQMGGGIGLNGN